MPTLPVAFTPHSSFFLTSSKPLACWKPLSAHPLKSILVKSLKASCLIKCSGCCAWLHSVYYFLSLSPQKLSLFSFLVLFSSIFFCPIHPPVFLTLDCISESPRRLVKPQVVGSAPKLLIQQVHQPNQIAGEADKAQVMLLLLQWLHFDTDVAVFSERSLTVSFPCHPVYPMDSVSHSHISPVLQVDYNPFEIIFSVSQKGSFRHLGCDSFLLSRLSLSLEGCLVPPTPPPCALSSHGVLCVPLSGACVVRRWFQVSPSPAGCDMVERAHLGMHTPWAAFWLTYFRGMWHCWHGAPSFMSSVWWSYLPHQVRQDHIFKALATIPSSK